MSNRERVEAEAREQYPGGDHTEVTAFMSDFAHVSQGAFVAGRTVTAEQVEAAARVMHNMTVDTLWGECWSEQAADLEVMRAAFRAAGLLIEREVAKPPRWRGIPTKGTGT